jgi:ubiquitin-conjugating enzyme E2 A
MSSSATTTQTTQQMSSKGQSPSTNSAASACLRLQSDLRSIRIEPPEVRASRALFFFPEKARHRRGKRLFVRYFPTTRGEEEECFLISSDAIAYTHRFITNTRAARTLLLLHIFLSQGCSASPHSDDNLFVWSATICGPQDSPWEGGIFSLRLTFSDSYPASAPRVRFVSEMFHPNIYPDGTLCMDTIQEQWSPVHSVASLLTSVRSLLCDPNVNSPANPQAAKMLVEEEKEYNKRVRRLARKTIE